MKKSRGSSVPGERVAKKGKVTPTRKIDFSDIPELSDEQLGQMKRVGRPPVGVQPKQAISLRLDRRLLVWLKRTAEERNLPYQTLISEILAEKMRQVG